MILSGISKSSIRELHFCWHFVCSSFQIYLLACHLWDVNRKTTISLWNWRRRGTMNLELLLNSKLSQCRAETTEPVVLNIRLIMQNWWHWLHAHTHEYYTIILSMTIIRIWFESCKQHISEFKLLLWMQHFLIKTCVDISQDLHSFSSR